MTLGEVATLIRSKNAGPFMLTIDIMFDDPAVFRRVVDSGVMQPATLAEQFGVDPATLALYVVEPALAIKVSFPRLHPSGDLADGDIFGGQQFSPLVDLEVPT